MRLALVMTPERCAEARRLAAEGLSGPEAARAMGINIQTLRVWAWRHGVSFSFGDQGKGLREWNAANPEVIRERGAKGRETIRARYRLPLTDAERRAYFNHQRKLRECGVSFTRADVYRAIGRADLAREAAE